MCRYSLYGSRLSLCVTNVINLRLMKLAKSEEILVRVLYMHECVSLERGRGTDIRDIAVLDPPAQPILSCFCVGVWTAACIALEVRNQ